MSKQVDERIVSMQFDNRHFEQNVQTSLRTVEKLKQSLNMKGAAKGLEEVDAASKKVNMSALGQAVESVGVKFSALQVMATTALANITKTAMDAGIKIAKALTIDPVTTGLSEYETKINAIQVIKANTRSQYDGDEEKQMADITAALDELNDYADRTIYNYSQMTNNVGKFVAQGLSVKDATKAVQGMANLAGASGASAEDMARATYQMSQALGGTIRLMDWNSLRNANMATTELKNTLIDLAKVNGVAIDDMIAKHGTFEQTLSEGWLTGEMFTKAMNIYSDVYSEAELKAMGFNDSQIKNFKSLAQMANEATTEVKTISQLWDVLKETAQSGWTQTWELIVGDFDTAKKTFTQLQVYFSNILNGWSEARNTILGGILDFGSVWGKITDKIENSGLGKIKDVAEKAGDAVEKVEKKLEDFQDIVNKVWKGDFGNADTGRYEKLNAAGWDSRVVQDLVNKGYQYKITMEDVEASHKKFGLTMDKSEKSTKKMSSAIGELTDKQLEKAGLTKSEITIYRDLEKEAKRTGKTISEVAEEMSKTDGRTLIIDTFKNAWAGLVNIFKIVKDIWEEVFPPVSVVRIYSIIKAVHDFSERLKNAKSVSEGVRETFKGVFALLGVVFKISGFVTKAVIGLIKIIAPAFFKLTGYIGDAIFALDEFLEKNDVLNTVLEKVKNAFDRVGSFIKGVCEKIRDKFAEIAEVNVEGVEKLTTKIEKRFEPIVRLVEGIKSVFIAIGKGVKKLFPVFAAIGSKIAEIFSGVFNGIADAIENADYNTLLDIINSGLLGGIMVMITRFIKSCKKITDEVGGFFEELKNILGDVRGILQSYQESIKADILMKIAKAVALLAVSLLVLSFIDSDRLTGSLLAITGLFTELMMAMKIFTDMTDGKELKGMVKLSLAMKTLGTSLLVLSIAMLILSKLSWSEMGVGLISIGAGLGALIGAMWALPSERKLNKSVRAIKKLAGAMIILAIALKIMGSMSWKEMGVGLISMGVGLGILIGAMYLIPNDIGVKALSLIPLATAIVILGAALRILGGMSWGEMAVGLASLAGSLIVIAGAMHLMPRNMLATGIGLMVVATSLTILAAAMAKFGGMSWAEIGKGLLVLGASLTILSVGLHSMKTTAGAAFSMLIVSVALSTFIPQLKALGKMSLKEIGIGLLALAGAFAVLGVAAHVLAPVLPALLGISFSMLMIGTAITAIGTGIMILSAGLTSLAASGSAVVGAIVLLVKGIVGLIPFVFEALAAGIVAFCGIISKGAPAIAQAIGSIVSMIIDIIVQNIPKIITGILKLVTDVLSALVEYAPVIIEKVFVLLIKIIDGIAAKAPELIQSLVNLLMSVCQGVVDALATVDKEILAEGLAGIGVLTAIIAAIGAVSGLIPPAILGVVGMGLVIAEMALVFGALGKLLSNQGLINAVSAGGDLMGAVGTAIGKFIGGLTGGFMGGVSSQLPQIGTDLATFMTNVKPFLEGAKQIDMSVLDGVAALSGCILALTTANLIDGLTSWLTGGVDLAEFGAKIAEFGPYMAKYAESVAGIDASVVTASASAAKALAEMAHEVPNEGGVASWFAGENSIATFGTELVTLGTSLKSYSDSIVGFDDEAVIASANAAAALANMAHEIPNAGGVASWFAGENSIATFGTELVTLGTSLKSYSDSIVGFDDEAVIASANAATALTAMAHEIPNAGGVASWFAGENSIAEFGTELITLGISLKSYSDSVSGLDVESVKASVNAATALARMANEIPNSGGVAAWFAGDNSVATFGIELIDLGKGLKGFADQVAGIDIAAVTVATSAATALAGMANVVPNSGGVVSWFAGENSIAAFGTELIELGKGLKGYSDAVAGFNSESVNTSIAAASAIAQMASTIPNEGGVAAWFAGENSIAKFGSELSALGSGLKGFSDAVIGIDPENMTVASEAAKTLADMAATIPNEGGMAAWFAGENSISKFGTDLVSLGAGLKGFSDEVTDIVPENVTAAASAAKALADMAATIPNEGGVAAWFAGENSIADFGDKLPDLGEALKGFADEVKGIEPDSVTAAASAAKSLAEMTDTLPKNTDRIVEFGENLISFGSKLKAYFNNVKGVSTDTIELSKTMVSAVKSIGTDIKPGKIEDAVDAVEDIIDLIKSVSKVEADSATNFTKVIKELGESGVDTIIKAFENGHDDLKKAGKTAVGKIINGLKDKSKISDLKDAAKELAKACKKAIDDKQSSFETSGKNVVKGFAKGISKNTYLAEAKAKEMAKAAANAAKKELDEHSPSKVFDKIGDFAGVAFVNSLGRYISVAGDTGTDLARNSIKGLRTAISSIGNVISGDLDFEPTIRPVLDLSNVESGASSISGMFSGRRTLSVDTAFAGAVSASMSGRQNGMDTSDIVSALNKLRKDVANMPRESYNINGITYDDDSTVTDAINTLVSAAKRERRT